MTGRFTGERDYRPLLVDFGGTYSIIGGFLAMFEMGGFFSTCTFFLSLTGRTLAIYSSSKLSPEGSESDPELAPSSPIVILISFLLVEIS